MLPPHELQHQKQRFLGERPHAVQPLSNSYPPHDIRSMHSDSETPPPFDFDYNAEIQPEYFEIAGGTFFHGTSRRAARKILKEGFRDWSWTAKNPDLRHLFKRGIVRWLHGGHFGRGTYVTKNWRTGLFFGPVLFRVSVQPGTRILRLDVPPDDKVVGSLRREFGEEILTQPPWKVLPRNKQLTLKEAIQLARYHFDRKQKSCSWDKPRSAMHEERMLDFRKTLVRYGIQGWGDPSSLGGIVIFATDRIQVTEVVLSLPQKDLLWDFNNQAYAQQRYRSLEAFVRQCLRSPNRGNAVTRKWVEESNQKLANKMRELPRSRGNGEF
jgi:hypothetical protein